MNTSDESVCRFRVATLAMCATLGLLGPAMTGCDQTGGEVAALPDEPAVATSAPAAVNAPAAGPAAAVPAPEPIVSETPTGPPRIEFETTTYDFGRVAETSKHRGQLEFKNTGGSTLVINEIKTTCGCTAVALEKRQYAPGETGTLEIEFDPVAPGDQKKYINILSNAEPTGFTRLMMVADVEGFIDIEPRMVELYGLRYGQEHRTTLTVSCPDPEFSIDSVSTSNPHVTAHVTAHVTGNVTGSKGGTRTVELVVDASAPWGGLFSWFTVTVTGRPSGETTAITHSSKARVQGDLFGELSVDSPSFRFGAKPNEVFTRTIRLERAGGASFEVLDATVTSTNLPGADVQANRIAPNAYDLVLTATAGAIRQSYRGTVEVRTDVQGEELLPIPISGVVRDQAKGVR